MAIIALEAAKIIEKCANVRAIKIQPSIVLHCYTMSVGTSDYTPEILNVRDLSRFQISPIKIAVIF